MVRSIESSVTLLFSSGAIAEEEEAAVVADAIDDEGGAVVEVALSALFSLPSPLFPETEEEDDVSKSKAAVSKAQIPKA